MRFLTCGDTGHAVGAGCGGFRIVWSTSASILTQYTIVSFAEIHSYIKRKIIQGRSAKLKQRLLVHSAVIPVSATVVAAIVSLAVLAPISTVVCIVAFSGTVCTVAFLTAAAVATLSGCLRGGGWLGAGVRPALTVLQGPQDLGQVEVSERGGGLGRRAATRSGRLRHWQALSAVQPIQAYQAHEINNIL
jgi:hypothetical protein